jgi:hypothetical protein
MGQHHPVDVPTQVLQDLLCAWHGGLAGDDPPFRSNRLRQGQVRAFLMEQREKPPAKELGEGMDGDQGGHASRAPLGPVRGDPTRWHQAVHVRMVG